MLSDKIEIIENLTEKKKKRRKKKVKFFFYDELHKDDTRWPYRPSATKLVPKNTTLHQINHAA